MEARWWPEIQLAEQGPGPQAACCIGFGAGAWGLRWKEAPSSGWTASFHASGSLRVDVLQTRDG